MRGDDWSRGRAGVVTLGEDPTIVIPNIITPRHHLRMGIAASVLLIPYHLTTRRVTTCFACLEALRLGLIGIAVGTVEFDDA